MNRQFIALVTDCHAEVMLPAGVMAAAVASPDAAMLVGARAVWSRRKRDDQIAVARGVAVPHGRSHN